MPNQYEAIIEAFEVLGGVRTIEEIKNWVSRKYENRWKDFGTAMADMVPLSLGGNHSSSAPDRLRVLERVSKGKYSLLSQAYCKVPPKEKPVSHGTITIHREPTLYEVNSAIPLLGKAYNNIKQIINNAEITHDGILRSFKEAGWPTEVSLLGSYRCDAHKDGVVVEVESVDKSSVIDVLHRDLFRFLMLQRMGKLKVAILITRVSGGEVSLDKVRKDMELFGKHYEPPLLVLGIPLEKDM
ncbi:MAG: hypothetical protein DRP89_07635 [Candidatus Neomarinimicrobiota bacterium]|nr:MAG: hypothetical protein DRP89_07635 [Candidatus Neomarinimicrobiota bacterium]